MSEEYVAGNFLQSGWVKAKARRGSVKLIYFVYFTYLPGFLGFQAGYPDFTTIRFELGAIPTHT